MPAKPGSINIFEGKDFENLVLRLRPVEAIHPESTGKFDKPKRKLSQVELTVKDSYNEFAWEFLRRNRFYQALVDGHKNLVPESQWGYTCHPNIARTHGLVQLKPYWETYRDGDPPAWIGLDSFAERLPITTNMEFNTAVIELQPGQVAVVFDVAGLIHGQSPWDIQAWAVRERLKELCENEFYTNEISGKPPHKKVLIRRLKMFDLLDEGRTLVKAAIELRYRQRKPVSKVKNSQSPFAPMHLQLGKSEPVTTAFDDASEAYKLVYRHGYIALLRGEKSYTLKGKRLVPDTIMYRDEDTESQQDW